MRHLAPAARAKVLPHAYFPSRQFNVELPLDQQVTALRQLVVAIDNKMLEEIEARRGLAFEVQRAALGS
jgi:hypothetical protein